MLSVALTIGSVAQTKLHDPVIAGGDDLTGGLKRNSPLLHEARGVDEPPNSVGVAVHLREVVGPVVDAQEVPSADLLEDGVIRKVRCTSARLVVHDVVDEGLLVGDLVRGEIQVRLVFTS